MVWCRVVLVLLTLGVFWPGPQVRAAESWRIAVIEDWPPYADKALGDKSLAVRALRQALRRIDVTAEVIYLPWGRAKHMVDMDDAYVGYYPAWPDSITEGRIASEPILYSPITLVSNKALPLRWKDRDLLRRHTIALVRTYKYPPFFLKMPNPVMVKSVEALLKSVAAKRAAYGVVDRRVAEYQLAQNPELQVFKAHLVLDPDDLMNMPLVIGFKDTPENRARNATLTEALKAGQ